MKTTFNKFGGGPPSGRERRTPAECSYWVGADRETLKLKIAERRAQQKTATPSDITNDPLVSATAALMKRKTDGWKATA